MVGLVSISVVQFACTADHTVIVTSMNFNFPLEQVQLVFNNIILTFIQKNEWCRKFYFLLFKDFIK